MSARNANPISCLFAGRSLHLGASWRELARAGAGEEELVISSLPRFDVSLWDSNKIAGARNSRVVYDFLNRARRGRGRRKILIASGIKELQEARAPGTWNSCVIKG